MSATGRGAVRAPSDCYPTPSSAARPFLRWAAANLPVPAAVLDPAAGNGALLHADREQWPTVRTAGLELRDEPRPERVDSWTVTDALGDTPASLPLRMRALGPVPISRTAVLGNPPFSLAREFVDTWSDPWRDTGGRGVLWAAWLLRLGFLSSQCRAEWLRARPPTWVLVLPKRPSFVGGRTDMSEYAWMVWTPGNTTRPWVDWLEVDRG